MVNVIRPRQREPFFDRNRMVEVFAVAFKLGFGAAPINSMPPADTKLNVGVTGVFGQLEWVTVAIYSVELLPPPSIHANGKDPLMPGLILKELLLDASNIEMIGWHCPKTLPVVNPAKMTEKKTIDFLKSFTIEMVFNVLDNDCERSGLILLFLYTPVR